MSDLGFKLIYTVEGVALVQELADARYAPRPATPFELALHDRVVELERLLEARREHCRRVHACQEGSE